MTRLDELIGVGRCDLAIDLLLAGARRVIRAVRTVRPVAAGAVHRGAARHALTFTIRVAPWIQVQLVVHWLRVRTLTEIFRKNRISCWNLLGIIIVKFYVAETNSDTSDKRQWVGNPFLTGVEIMDRELRSELVNVNKLRVQYQKTSLWQIHYICLFVLQIHIITARVRSTTGRYCFHRCLSIHIKGGGRGGGGTHLLPKLFPLVPCSFWGDVQVQMGGGWILPSRSIWRGGVHTSSNGGTPPSRSRQGGTPVQG